MRRNSRRRPTGARRATFAAVALILGGGGLVAANVYASASEGGWGGTSQSNQSGDQVLKSGTVTIDCPDVGSRLTAVPQRAKADVDKELALLDQQITDAYARLTATRQAQANDANYVQDAILGPLEDKRTAVIDRIKTDYQQVGASAPGTIDGQAACTGVSASPTQTGGQNGDNGGGQQGTGGQNNGGQNNGGQQGTGGQAASGPVASDFVDITTVQPNVAATPQQDGNASTGSFTTLCGV
ncbi:hypothetical protein AAW14_32895, partial [Streptomyces hygroscopicus]|nr:hypothetical protein [Streptomyces hygroscopicus]